MFVIPPLESCGLGKSREGSSERFLQLQALEEQRVHRTSAELPDMASAATSGLTTNG